MQLRRTVRIAGAALVSALALTVGATGAARAATTVDEFRVRERARRLVAAR